MGKITYRQEVYRKLIHLTSLWIPLAIWLLPHGVSVILLAALLPLSFFVEIMRSYPNSKFTKLYNKFFCSLLRDHEKCTKRIKITGATYVIVAALFCVIFFSKIIAVVALSVMLISDTAAALVGRKFGRNKMGEGKTVEGCLAFVLSGIMVVYALGYLDGQISHFYFSGCIAVIMALLAELYSRKLYIDDNLSIPLVVGIIMSVI
jgi:dolichol kinase